MKGVGGRKEMRGVKLPEGRVINDATLCCCSDGFKVRVLLEEELEERDGWESERERERGE